MKAAWRPGNELKAPQQDSCDTPPEDRKNMPACPQNAYMTLAKQRAAVRWHHPTFTEPPEDETLAEDGVNKPD